MPHRAKEGDHLFGLGVELMTRSDLTFANPMGIISLSGRYLQPNYLGISSRGNHWSGDADVAALRLETGPHEIEMRVIDLFTPIGKDFTRVAGHPS
jgi:hypothetical protein